MTKHTCFGVLFIIAIAFLCSDTTAHSKNTPYVTDLIAAQHYDIGEVTVWNDEDFLYVKYEITWYWVYFLEVHCHVATSLEGIPQNNGNPIPGQFDYQNVFDRKEQEFTFQIPMDPAWVNGTELYVAAHATVIAVCGLTETAWGDGIPFQGLDSWGMYFIYTVQLPPGPIEGNKSTGGKRVYPVD
ncbi:MAG: hypothetical protein ACYTG7_09755 [Planctomycetota bacterium]|jgi:hypothetical protein